MNKQQVKVMRKDLWKVVEQFYKMDNVINIKISNGLIPNMYIVEIEKHGK